MTIKNRTIVGLQLACYAWGAAASAAQPATATCDRECLRGKVTELLYALVEHDMVYDGQIHAVEAFVRILPVERRNGGWE